MPVNKIRKFFLPVTINYLQILKVAVDYLWRKGHRMRQKILIERVKGREEGEEERRGKKGREFGIL